ncbi:MAG: DnaJ domain-containing protein [Thermaerobacter sp.]|jgi:hypothetical protein|nr:DnaJ domain-containing protein [Thermaerobacter sp.]
MRVEYVPGRDYYEVLLVPDGADAERIQENWRRQAAACHPDRNPGAEAAANERLKLLNEARDVLTNPKSRSAYDRARTAYRTRVGTAEVNSEGQDGSSAMAAERSPAKGEPFFSQIGRKWRAALRWVGSPTWPAWASGWRAAWRAAGSPPYLVMGGVARGKAAAGMPLPVWLRVLGAGFDAYHAFASWFWLWFLGSRPWLTMSAAVLFLPTLLLEALAGVLLIAYGPHPSAIPAWIAPFIPAFRRLAPFVVAELWVLMVLSLIGTLRLVFVGLGFTIGMGRKNRMVGWVLVSLLGIGGLVMLAAGAAVLVAVIVVVAVGSVFFRGVARI